MTNYIRLDLNALIEELQATTKSDSIVKLNENAFSKLKSVNNSLMMCCPFHNESRPSFGISDEPPYLYNCFGCGEKGNIYTLIEKVLNVSYIEAIKYIHDTSEEETYIDISKLFPSESEIQLGEYILDGFTKNYSYLKGRGISSYTQEKYEVLYDKNKNAVVFPIRDEAGKLVSLQSRLVTGKFFYNLGNVKKTEYLYGLHQIISSKIKFDAVYVTESIIDALSCFENGKVAVSLMGRALSNKQLKLLTKHFKQVILFLDNDDVGKEATREIAKKLLSVGMSVKFVVNDTQYKDANELHLAKQFDKLRLMNEIEYILNGGKL